MESQTFLGDWWLPEDPNNKVSGILTFSNEDEITLELIGSFKTIKPGPITEESFFTRHKIILGITTKGKPITLYRCNEKSSPINFSNKIFISSTFSIHYILIGGHFEKEEELVFRSMKVSYSHLNEWAGISGFNKELEFEKETKKMLRHSVSFQPPNEIEANINNFQIKLTYSFNSNALTRNSSEISFRQTTFLQIQTERHEPLKKYISFYLHHLQNFLTLGMDRIIYIESLTGKSPNSTTSFQNGNVEENEITILFTQKKEPDSKKILMPYDMLFCFDDIKEDWALYLGNWYSLTNSIDSVFHLLFSISNNPNMYIHNQFLGIAQAIEGFHRCLLDGQYLTNAKFEELLTILIKAIPDGIDSGYRSVLSNKLRWMNSFSLRKRIKDLWKRIEPLGNLITGKKNEFIDSVVENRNMLTHPQKRSESPIPEELFALVKEMKYFLLLCLLHEIGIPHEKTITLFKRNQQFLFLKAHYFQD